MNRGFTGNADVPSAHGLSGNADADKMSAVPVESRLFVLPDALQRQLADEARAAYPRECCGLIEGVRAGETIEAVALHPTRNLASASDRFEIDPAEHIRLLRTLRGTGREIVGCYHSHPDGEPKPSPRDRDSAHDEDFVWLIAGLDAAGTVTPAGFLFRNGDFCPLALA
jgi:proteasome lid subunit RPN8/RPN11